MPSPTAFTTALLRMNETWPLREAARAFAAAGVPVFPCAPRGKRPLIRDGQGFRDATTDLTQIDAWWQQSPEANIGIPTGAASGVVVRSEERRVGKACSTRCVGNSLDT